MTAFRRHDQTHELIMVVVSHQPAYFFMFLLHVVYFASACCDLIFRMRPGVSKIKLIGSTLALIWSKFVLFRRRKKHSFWRISIPISSVNTQFVRWAYLLHRRS